MTRLYMDQDSMAQRVVNGLRAAGHDVLTTVEAGRLDTDDDDQLRYATETGRILYTGNKGDFARLTTSLSRTGGLHLGVIIRHWQQMPDFLQVRALLRVLDSRSQEAFVDHVEYLDAWLHKDA